MQFFIFNQIKSTSFLEQIFIPEFVNKIKMDNKNITFEYLNYDYNLFLGLEINEIRIKHIETQEILCYIEDLVIQVGVLESFFSKDIKIKKIVIKKPKCNFKTENFYNRIANLQKFLLDNNIKLEMIHLEKIEAFSFLEGLEIFFYPIEKERKVRITGKITEKEKTIIKIYGFWFEDSGHSKNTIHFDLYNFPVYYDSFFKNFLGIDPKPLFSDFKISFRMSGKGSIDITTEGYAVHFFTNFQDFQLGTSFFWINQLDGKIKYLVVKEWNDSIEKKEITIYSPSLSLYMDKFKERDSQFMRFDLHLPIDNSQIKTVWNSKGIISFKGSIRKAKDIGISIEGTIDKLVLLHKAKFPVVFISKANLFSTKDHAVEFHIDGKFNSVDFRYLGVVEFDFHKVPIFNIRSKYIMPSVDYQILFESAIQIFQTTKEEALKENAIQFTDFGPAWENKFQNSEIYKNYLKNTNFLSEIEFKNPKQNLPEILGTIKNTEMGFSLSLQGNHPHNLIKINYSIDYLATVPYHNFSILVNLKNSEISLPFFCKNCESHIKRIYFNYNSNANGLYIADLYLNNNSSFILEIDNINLDNNDKKELLEKFLETSWKNEFFNLRAKFSSYGAIYNPIDIQIENEKINLKGYGSYNIFSEGKLTFYFLDKKNPIQRNFNLKIRRDGTWVPLYFY
ncbi:MAG: hypothetical protein ACK4UJ_10550 [Leptonema sp. (in: bacteria)]